MLNDVKCIRFFESNANGSKPEIEWSALSDLSQHLARSSQ